MTSSWTLVFPALAGLMTQTWVPNTGAQIANSCPVHAAVLLFWMEVE